MSSGDSTRIRLTHMLKLAGAFALFVAMMVCAIRPAPAQNTCTANYCVKSQSVASELRRVGHP